jgi:predicted ATPase
VTGESETMLTRLHAKSVFRAEAGATGGTRRYRLHEAQRVYALDLLKQSGEYEEIAERHAHHVVDFLVHADSIWESMSELEWQKLFLP